MSERVRLRRWLVFGLALVFTAAVGLPSSAVSKAAQDEQVELVQRLKELFDGRESKRLITPLPGSRSIIISVDGSADYFAYLERGSIRGDAIDTFYEQYDAGDIDAAHDTFQRNSLVVWRVSDFGWNGLGHPMTTETGSEIQDVHFEVVEGSFMRTDPEQDDIDAYIELLRDVVIPALEGGS